jgi:hypothetical protein
MLVQLFLIAVLLGLDCFFLAVLWFAAKWAFGRSAPAGKEK